MPVDSLAPKAKAIKVTCIMAIPLIPDLEIPKTKEAVRAMTHAVEVISTNIDCNTGGD